METTAGDVNVPGGEEQGERAVLADYEMNGTWLC